MMKYQLGCSDIILPGFLNIATQPVNNLVQESEGHKNLKLNQTVNYYKWQFVCCKLHVVINTTMELIEKRQLNYIQIWTMLLV